MALNSHHSLIKNLYTRQARGMPFDLSTLAEQGISAQLAAKYVDGGWLDRLGQGVYAFPNDRFDAYGAVKFLQTRIPGLHIGGKTALALQGVRHNVVGREQLVLWGDARFVLPNWFTERFPARYCCAQLFKWAQLCPAAATLGTPPGCREGLQVAVPECAVLEMLYDVGNKQNFEEAYNLFSGLRNLRKDVLGNMLSICASVKTVRLFLAWSRETNVVDANDLLARFPILVGSKRRWIGRLKDGTLLTLKP